MSKPECPESMEMGEENDRIQMKLLDDQITPLIQQEVGEAEENQSKPLVDQIKLLVQGQVQEKEQEPETLQAKKLSSYSSEVNPNLEARINVCRTTKQQADALAYESEELLSLTAFIAYQSRGLPMRVATGGTAGPYLKRGEAFFNRRQGQLNLSCANCHVDHVGKRLRGDIISQGLGNGYPAYRIEWQSIGSLHRRLRACSFGVRAVRFDYGSQEYLELELYLAARANGVKVETPAIRR